MANPNPVCKFQPKNKEALAKKPVAVRLTKDLDAYVRSQPDPTEWLRKAIAAQVERDMQLPPGDCA
jgi:hypothetical protein